MFFKHYYWVVKGFLNEEQRNKILVDDILINGKVSLPPKSDFGREVKNAVRKANVEARWYFNFDRIEYIRFGSCQPSVDWKSKPAISLLMPSGTGIHQRQRKFNCMIQLEETPDPTTTTQGNLIIYNPENSTELIYSRDISSPGDLIVVPSFVPCLINHSTQPIKWVNVVLEGPSFR